MKIEIYATKPSNVFEICQKLYKIKIAATPESVEENDNDGKQVKITNPNNDGDKRKWSDVVRGKAKGNRSKNDSNSS